MKPRRNLSGILILATVGAGWIYGIAIAEGFLSTAAAVIFPGWAWVLVCEKFILYVIA